MCIVILQTAVLPGQADWLILILLRNKFQNNRKYKVLKN